MKYYSVLRPVSIGTYPKDGAQEIHNFNDRIYIDSIGRDAWGYIVYDRELSKKEYESWDLLPENSGANRKALELTAGKLLMAAGYSGKEALETVKSLDIEELLAIVA